MKDFVGDEIPEAELRKIVAETIAFEIPLKKSDRKYFGFRTFHGTNFGFLRMLAQDL